MEICRLENIHKDYRNGEVVTPLNDVSLAVNSGDFVVIEGPSGIGKSTLLYVMGTLLRADSGKIFFEGKEITSLSDKELTALRAEKIGFMFQDANLIQALTLRENLMFAQSLGKKSKADVKKVDEALERFGLADRANFLPHQLSGGQRRRAMAARCFINSPSLILADEPTNDLDEEWAAKIIDLLTEEAEKGAGIVMVTHNTKWAEKASVRYRLTDGSIEKL